MGSPRSLKGPRLLSPRKDIHCHSLPRKCTASLLGLKLPSPLPQETLCCWEAPAKGIRPQRAQAQEILPIPTGPCLLPPEAPHTASIPVSGGSRGNPFPSPRIPRWAGLGKLLPFPQELKEAPVACNKPSKAKAPQRLLKSRCLHNRSPEQEARACSPNPNRETACYTTKLPQNPLYPNMRPKVQDTMENYPSYKEAGNSQLE